MRRALLLAAAVAVSCHARAAEPAFSPTQRAAIVSIVREALKTDPSILRDAVMALREDEQKSEAADTHARLAANAAALRPVAGDAVAGNPDADVTLVEFYDPRCQYCRRMLPTVQALLKQDKKIRVLYKDIPVLGPASVMEARAILAAQAQGGYEKMQLALMQNPAQPSEAMIRETAHGLGLNADRLMTDMNSAAVTKRLDTNLALARALHVEGTPVWIVGDTFIPGAVDEAALVAAVAAARRAG